jgi:hypothetical protein
MDAVVETLRIIAPPLLTVVFGAYVAQRYFFSRANEAAMVDFMIRDLHELQKDALEYWALPSDSKENKQHQTVLAQIIKGAIKSISADVNYYCQRYCKTKGREMDKFLEEVLDACTGGDFESANKKVDTGRYLRVVNTINRVKSELHRRKL